MGRTVTIACLLLTGGCGDDSGSTDAGRPAPDAPPGDSGAVDGGGAGNDELTVEVVAASRVEAERTPLEGATVALDGPDGRVELQTDAAGRVTFTGLTLSESHTVTAHLEGRNLFTVAGIDRTRLDTSLADEALLAPDGAVRLPLGERPLAPDELVTVTGTVSGMLDEGHFLNITATSGFDAHQDTGTAFELEVEPGEAFDLYVIEFHPGEEIIEGRGYTTVFDQVRKVSVDALDADATVDVDFADGTIATQTSTGSFSSPPGEFFERADLFVFLRSSFETDFAGLGGLQRLELVGDRFELEATTWAEGRSDEEVITQFFFQTGPRFSGANLTGDRLDDDTDIVFQSPVDPVTPAFGVAHPMEEAITWDLVETEGFSVQVTVDDRFLWQVVAGPSATSVIIPDPPSSASDLLDGEIEGRIITCGLNLSEGRCDRFAAGRVFELVP